MHCGFWGCANVGRVRDSDGHSVSERFWAGRGAGKRQKVKAFSAFGLLRAFSRLKSFKDTHLDFKSMRAACSDARSGAIAVLDGPAASGYDIERDVFFRDDRVGNVCRGRVGSQKPGHSDGPGRAARFVFRHLHCIGSGRNYGGNFYLRVGAICPVPDYGSPARKATSARRSRAHVLNRKCPAGVCSMAA